MKICLTLSYILEYEPNPENYPEGSTPEQMLKIDLKNAEEDINLISDKYNHTNISGEIITEETENLRACLGLITDAYQRMATNRDPEYRAKQLSFCEKRLETMTQIIETEAQKNSNLKTC